MPRAHGAPRATSQATTPVVSPLSPAEHGRVILNSDEMRRAIARIAHEILERTDGAHDVVLAGLYVGGVPLAERLSATLHAIEAIDVPVAAIDFTPFRDDLRERGPLPTLGPTTLPGDITGATVVLVDDVLCTGRSMRAALDALLKHGRPARVQVAALIDRGHRELPIRADYVGKNVPTGRDEWVEVRLHELYGHDCVRLMREGERSDAR